MYSCGSFIEKQVGLSILRTSVFPSIKIQTLTQGQNILDVVNIFTIDVALDGECMIASLLANDKGTRTSSCVSIADIYHTGLGLMFS